MAVSDFYQACSDMKNAKCILADAKIAKVLKTIVADPELISAVGEALVNFNFDNELSKALVKNELQSLYFQLPKEQDKIIALVFGILSEIDAHRMDLHAFLHEFFNAGQDGLVESFSRFVREVILPFRDTMCQKADYEPPRENGAHSLEDADLESSRMVGVLEKCNCGEGCDCGADCQCEVDPFASFFEDITVILNQIKDTINLDTKLKADRRDELNITIEALLLSLEMWNLKIMNALMISLNNLLAPVKSVRFYNHELQDRLVRFYSQIS